MYRKQDWNFLYSCLQKIAQMYETTHRKNLQFILKDQTIEMYKPRNVRD
jgi:hypothetical protein